MGTSFSAPLVAGTAALMLSAKPTLTPAEVLATLRATARAFPTSGGGDGAATPVCTVPQPVGFPQIDQGECYCTTNTCGAGMLDAGAAVSAVLNGTPVGTANYQGLWWNAPAGSESGWGINVNHQGNTIFATWFTFGLDDKPLWLVMSATSTPGAPNVFSGNLFTGTGPPFNAFDPAKVVPAPVGLATLTFTDRDNGTLAYSVNGIAQIKAITREVFGSPVPTCVFGAQPNLALATNFQDLWWNAPAESEPGWGLNMTHQGNTIFASWFTYGLDGAPLWLVAAANLTAPNVYTGTLVKAVSGPAFKSVPFDPSQVNGAPTGSVTLSFADGNNAAFAYSIDGIAQAKQITREILVRARHRLSVIHRHMHPRSGRTSCRRVARADEAADAIMPEWGSRQPIAQRSPPCPDKPLPAKEFEPEFTTALIAIFEEKVVFNQVLGLRITSVAPGRASGRIDMRHELIGSFAHNRVHGGVISAGLDAMAGLAVMAALGARHMDEPVAQRLARFARVGTIDLRIDYLRPGISEHFELRAEVMRIGSRVASTRMEFLGADGTLLSTGTAAYIVS